MTAAHFLSVQTEKRDVELHYTGAEGITFQDAIFVITNNGYSPVVDVVLRLKVSQEGNKLFDGDVWPEILGKDERLEAGESVSLSVFRIFQKNIPGFSSRVNMFGYKAALNWSFEVIVLIDDLEAMSKIVRWAPSSSDPQYVEVDVL